MSAYLDGSLDAVPIEGRGVLAGVADAAKVPLTAPGTRRRLACGRLTPAGTLRARIPHADMGKVAVAARDLRSAGYTVEIVADPIILNGKAPDVGARVAIRKVKS
jgi:hypothetical protein